MGREPARCICHRLRWPPLSQVVERVGLGGPENLGGSNLRNSPSAVAWAANRLDIFAIGADGHLYHKWWNGSAWGGPENLGGSNLRNSPSAVAWAANRLDI